MRKQKAGLILILAALLAVGWGIVMRSATGAQAREKQNELLAAADGYMERELYVRAIPLYEQALTYSSELNPSIQEKLLAAYWANEEPSPYLRLVEKRASEGTAREEEYQNAADYYLARSKNQEAMEWLRRGMEATGSPMLQAYYEEHRYEYRLRTTRYQTIRPTADNAQMPAFDGEKWGYIDEGGALLLDFIYDSATAFNNAGVAVVSLNGTYYTILANGDIYGADDGTNGARMTDVTAVSGTRVLGEREGNYSYFNYDFEPIATDYQYTKITANACGVAAVQKDGYWGIITDSGKTVVDFTWEDVAINSLGCVYAAERAMVKENGLWYLVDLEGKHISETGYADAKAPESDGYIAVADTGGRWGYIDESGELVIDCQYEEALSFSDGLGAVRPANDWGYISEENVLQIEDIWQSAQPFHNGIAQVETVDGTALITLKYVEE